MRKEKLEEEKKKKKEATNPKMAQQEPKKKRAAPEESKNPKPKKQKNTELVAITYLFIGLFMMLIGYFVYFNVMKAQDIVNSPYNPRLDLFADRIIRGSILSSDDDVLAYTDVAKDGTETRVYPYGAVFAHAIGYSTHGKSGVESLGNFNLLASNEFFLDRFTNSFLGEKNEGDSVVTTLNTKLQQVAYDALGSNDGAAIVIEPSTGKILAMVSKPDYDPNVIATQYDTIIADAASSVLLNRAAQGQYPPGSTFKIVTTLAYMRQNPDYDSYTYNCLGTIGVDDFHIGCQNGSVHGLVNLSESFALSCNTSYGNIGLMLDNAQFANVANELLFNTSLPFPLASSTSKFVLTEGSSRGDQLTTAIGQGNTLVSPLHMALIASAIANDGVLMKPYLIDHVENVNGDLVESYSSSTYGALISSSEAAILEGYMEQVVLNGTGGKLAGQNYTVAGKTGSAEFNSVTHSWFVGYSNVEDPDIVVCVIGEGAGTGSSFSVPVAKQIFDAYYN